MTELTESILNSNAQIIAEKLKENKSNEEIKKMLVLKGFTVEQIQQIFVKAQQLIKKEELVKKFLQEIKPQNKQEEKKEIQVTSKVEIKKVEMQNELIEETKPIIENKQALEKDLEKIQPEIKSIQEPIKQQQFPNQFNELPTPSERRIVIISKESNEREEIREAQRIMRSELHKGNSFEKCIELLLKSGFNEEEIKEILQSFIVKE